MNADPPENDRPPVNLARLGDTFGDDPEFLTEMYGLYIEDASGRLAELDSALAGDDAEKVKSIAHTLKGSSGNVGAERMSALAAELERIDSTQDRPKVQELAAALHIEFDAVQAFLKEFVPTPL